MIRDRNRLNHNTNILIRTILHLLRKNIRFIAIILILLTVLLNIINHSTSTSKPILAQFDYLNEDYTLPSKLDPSINNIILTNVTTNETETKIQEQTIKQKVISERLKSGYKKYNQNSTQYALVESLSNKGYRPKACLLITLFSPTGERINHQDIYTSIESIQSKFNNWFGYTWILLSKDGNEYNDSKFMNKIDDLIQLDSIDVKFEIVNNEYLNHEPDWIDVNKIADSQIRLSGFEFGDSQFYRSINRYMVGYLPLETFLDDFDWVWRIEPGFQLLCDIDYDLFRWMQDRNQIFGFLISYMEPHKEKVENLWKIFKDFANDFKSKKDIVDFEKNNFQFNTEFKDLPKEKDEKKRKELEREAAKHGIGSGTSDYNRCQYVSNFQLININFFKSKPFIELFKRLDKDGGFYYHGWSASSVTTLAINLLLKRDQIYFFDNIGFQLSSHSLTSSSSQLPSISRNFYNCPIDDATYREFNCQCDQGLDFTFMKDSCTAKFYDSTGRKKPDDWDKH